MDSMELERERDITSQSATPVGRPASASLASVVDYHWVEARFAFSTARCSCSAVSGVQSVSRLTVRCAATVPRVAFVNKLDVRRTPKVTEQLARSSSQRGGADPIGAEDQLAGVVDLVNMRAYCRGQR